MYSWEYGNFEIVQFKMKKFNSMNRFWLHVEITAFTCIFMLINVLIIHECRYFETKIF